MSVLFNRNKVLKTINKATPVLITMKHFMELKLKMVELAIKVSSDEDLKNDLCDSLERVCDLVELEGKKLLMGHASKYQEDTVKLAEEFDNFKNNVDSNKEDKFGTDEQQFAASGMRYSA